MSLTSRSAHDEGDSATPMTAKNAGGDLQGYPSTGDPRRIESSGFEISVAESDRGSLDRTRVLVPIGEPIGGQMSAVGIRQFEVGRTLAVHCDVTFASTAETNDEAHGVRVVPCRTRADFRRLLQQHDVVYTLGLNPDR